MFASQDPVAIESVLFDLFQLDTDPYQYAKIPGAQDYLVEAAQANNPPSGTFYDPNHAVATQRLSSLGVYEHWNNSIDRKYSRNLMTGNGIELVFINGAASAVRPPVGLISAPSVYSLRALSKTKIIEFSIPGRARIKLALFNGQGALMAVALDAPMGPGIHRINAISTQAGKTLSPGFYVLALYNKDVNEVKPEATCSLELLGR
jgi:hypothetical protein